MMKDYRAAVGTDFVPVTIAPLLCNNCALVLFFVVYDKMERFVFYRNIKDKIG